MALAHQAAAADEGRGVGRLCCAHVGSVRPYRMRPVEPGRRLGYRWLDVGLCEGPVVIMEERNELTLGKWRRLIWAAEINTFLKKKIKTRKIGF